MTGMAERRRVARLGVPRGLGGGAVELRQVHLLDLSPAGARIEHEEHLHEGLVCYVDLPRPRGRVRLTGRVVWTRLRDTEQTLDGDRRSHYESGIEFTGPTPEQQAALAATLATLQTAQDLPNQTGDIAMPPDASPTEDREPSA
jgi:hypothetical protein